MCNTHQSSQKGEKHKLDSAHLFKQYVCGVVFRHMHTHDCASGYATRVCSLTICARRYICAWLAVSVGLDGLPSRTACWEILVGVELMLWALLMSCAAAGEVVRLI